MKKLTRVLVLLLIFSVVLSGCSKNDSKNKNADDKVVVAKINGESIYKDELIYLYDKEKIAYGITEEMENDSTMSGSIKQFKLDILDNMVNNRLLEQKAGEEGFKKDDSYLEKAETYYNDTIKRIAEDMEKEDKDSEEETDVDYNEEAKKYLDEYISKSGFTTDEYLKLLADQIFLDEYIKNLVSDVEANEAEVKDYYDEQLEEQKEKGKASSGHISIFEGNKVRIKYIMFDLPYEEITEYESMMMGGKIEEAKEYAKEKLAAIKPKADEAYEKINSGESFEDMLDEYAPNIWVDQLEDGYLMERNDPYLASLEEDVFSLKKGEVSDIIETDYGYFIVKAYEIIDEKTYSFDEKKEEIKDLLDNTMKAEKFNDTLSQWVEESEIEIFEGKI